MTSAEYISELKECLQGEVSAQIIQETVDYYGQYIIREVNSGKTEEQVIQELGSARLIAKSIIDAQAGAGRKEEAWREEAKRQEERENRHFHAGVNEKGQFDVQYGKFSFNSWYGKLLLILAAILVVALIIAAIVGFVMLSWYLLPVIAVVVLVLIFVIIFVNIGRKH